MTKRTEHQVETTKLPQQRWTNYLGLRTWLIVWFTVTVVGLPASLSAHPTSSPGPPSSPPPWGPIEPTEPSPPTNPNNPPNRCNPLGPSNPGGPNNSQCPCGCDSGGGCNNNNPTPPQPSPCPIYYRYGAVFEQAVDISLPAVGTPGTGARSYMSNGTGTSALGNKWLSNTADTYLMQQGSNISLLVSAASQLLFTYNSGTGTFTPPGDSNNLQLTHDATHTQYILVDQLSNQRTTFNDFTVSNTAIRGKPKEVSTLQWYTQGNSGFVYSYNTSGTISQITSPTGQDYNVVYTYNTSNLITQIQVQDGSGHALEQVNYTYYQNVTSPSTDLGTTNDLVQVQVSKHATTDASGTMSIVRYTQYRYSGTTSQLKAVYNHDAIQRILASTGVTTPAAIMSHADTYGTPAIQDFANKAFTYYGSSPPSATSVNTPFAANENLVSKYTNSVGSSAIANGMVATETVGGCGGCGTSYSVTKSYFYLALPNSTTDQNQVVSLVVEDTQDSAGNAVYRHVLGFENTGRMLRKAFIQSPESSPTYWCESWTFATSTGSTALPYRMAEHRHPSAHTGVTTATNLQAFLNPYNGSSWSNDTSTVNSSSGLVETFGYNSTGMLTDAWVKNGESGTANYVSATDYGDSVNSFLSTATWDYPTETTTRSNGQQTAFSYTFYDSSTHQQIETKTTTLPTISTGQNGSGVATTTGEYYDNLGRLRWTQDGEGYINYYSYNPTTGTVAYQALDIDPASPGSDVTSGSSGNWDAVAIGGASSNQPTRSSSLPSPLLLATKNYYDSIGRQIHTTDSGGNNNYMAYANLQTIKFPFWNSTTSQCTLPIQVTNLNSGAQVGDRISVRASYTAISTSSGAPTGFSTAPSQNDYVEWTHYTYDATTGWLTYTDRYIDSPSSGYGTLSTDFYRTVTQYDTLGRKNYMIEVIRGSVSTNRVEQVTQYVYDVRDRVIQVNKGVSGDTAANSQNMTDSYNVYPTLYTISQTVYDNGGVGDGYVTKTRQFFGTGSTSYTGTNFYRTYRGHLRGIEPFYVSSSTETPIGPYTVNDVDWKGRATTTAKYSADPTWSSALTGDGYSTYASTTSTNRLTENGVLYDNLGRVYQTQVYDISPSTGSGSNYLAQNSYYDRNDLRVATAPAYAAASETAYDGAGRPYERRTAILLQSTLYSSGAYQYCSPKPNPSLASMSGGDNGVLTLAHQTFDANGNVLETDTFEDNHDDVTGSNPGINLSSNSDYVRRTAFSWYDAANRLITSADFGSGDTSTSAGQWKYAAIPSRPSSMPTASANTYLITLYGYYSDSGRLQAVTDPAGTVTKSFYDNLGRTTYVAANWQNFVAPNTGTGNPNDRVTQYVYDGPSRTQQLVAMDPNGDGNLSDNQVTTYLFEDPVDANRNTSQIYPDSTDTTSSGTNQIKLAYNVDGSLSQRTDQRGVVIAYSYANNRLPSLQSVTTVPTGVDGTVQSIGRAYDSLNRVQNITSYGSTGGTGTVVNDLQYAYYNGTEKVATSYQSHSGAVNTSTTLNVQYTYDTTTNGSIYSNQLRLQTEVHPNSRAIYYDYGSSGSSTAAYNATSTVREIWDGSPSGTGLAVYDYNGAGSGLAIATYPQPSFKLDHFEGTSGIYAGLDRFGRIIDQYWAGFSGTSDVDRIHYAYDYVGNRTYRQIDPAIYPTENMDKAFTYDALRRLLTSQVGKLSGTTISGTPASEEDWTLDGLGNWANHVTKSSGTVNLNQSRTGSSANEISGISASVGPTWAVPAYDLAGNMTIIPIPTNLTSSYTAVYDAWNRLVSLSNGSATMATYSYDGLNRRIVKGIYVSGALDHNEHAYYNEGWQILEVRKEVSGTINGNPLEQYIWHPFYIDAPVLRDYDAATSGSPTRYYYTFDGNYNVMAATSNAGGPAERYGYSPYGTVTFLDGSFNVLSTQQSQIGNSVTYTGRQLDPDSGLYCYRNRFLHPGCGTFLSRDPIEYRGGDLNLYNYARNKPEDLFDPMGLECPGCPTPWHAPTIGGIQYQYGCYCGKEPTPPRPPATIPPPIDPIDAACQTHDGCCGNPKTTDVQCNADLCKNANNAMGNDCALKACNIRCCVNNARLIIAMYCGQGKGFCH